MNAGALFFLVAAWGIILLGVATSMVTILKKSK